MSFAGRNWAKVGKKLLQVSNPTPAGLAPGATAARGSVTPLANQLVAANDSVLGRYSNQGGSACTAANIPVADRTPTWVGNSAALAAGKPGLCISYVGLIRRAYYAELWQNNGRHLNGCYTDDGNPDTPQNTPVCAAPTDIPVLVGGVLNNVNTHDPFDGYVLTIADTAAVVANTNQFTQMEANMSLFWGLSIHAWASMLVSDDAPFDRFMDDNPESYKTFGESDEPNLALDLLNCGQPILRRDCLRGSPASPRSGTSSATRGFKPRSAARAHSPPTARRSHRAARGPQGLSIRSWGWISSWAPICP